jgi:GNAT superfamily N-acetyltransferase
MESKMNVLYEIREFFIFIGKKNYPILNIVSLEKTNKNYKKVIDWLKSEGSGLRLDSSIKPDSHFFQYNFTILEDNEIIGMITFSYNKGWNFVSIDNLLVSKTYRKRNLGKILINKVILFAEDIRRDIIVRPAGDESAKFYLHLGFKMRIHIHTKEDLERAEREGYPPEAEYEIANRFYYPIKNATKTSRNKAKYLNNLNVVYTLVV